MGKEVLATQVNIRIMRVFNQIRTALIGVTDICLEIAEIKNALARQGKRQNELNERIKRTPISPDREMLGYKIAEINDNKQQNNR